MNANDSPQQTDGSVKRSGESPSDIEKGTDLGNHGLPTFQDLISRNKWGIAACTVLMHLSIGSVYACSVLVKPLGAAYGWSSKEVTAGLSIAVAVLGMTAAVLGPVVERWGPRKAGTIAGLLYGAGFALAGVACQYESLIGFYFGYSVIASLGRGIGYIAPVATLVSYFPRHRGFATGMAIMGFGFGALAYSPFMEYTLTTYEPPVMFYILGPWYAVVMVLPAQYMKMHRTPGEREVDPHVTEHASNRGALLGTLSVRDAIRTRHLWAVWLMMYINVTCGIAIIAAASPMLQDTVGLASDEASIVVGLLGLFNGTGRLFWSSISDRLGRPRTYMTMFVLQAVAFVTLPSMTDPAAFQVLLFLILTCYGGGFAMLPAFVGDLFGLQNLGAILGVALTAWSAAGLTGPLVFTALQDATGAVDTALYAFGALFGVALAVGAVMDRSVQRLAAQGGAPEGRPSKA